MYTFGLLRLEMKLGRHATKAKISVPVKTKLNSQYESDKFRSISDTLNFAECTPDPLRKAAFD